MYFYARKALIMPTYLYQLNKKLNPISKQSPKQVALTFLDADADHA